MSSRFLKCFFSGVCASRAASSLAGGKPVQAAGFAAASLALWENKDKPLRKLFSEETNEEDKEK